MGRILPNDGKRRRGWTGIATLVGLALMTSALAGCASNVEQMRTSGGGAIPPSPSQGPTKPSPSPSAAKRALLPGHWRTDPVAQEGSGWSLTLTPRPAPHSYDARFTLTDDNAEEEAVVLAQLTVTSRSRVTVSWRDGSTTPGRVARTGSGKLASIDLEPCYEHITPIWVPELDCLFFPSSAARPVTVNDRSLNAAWQYICRSTADALPYLTTREADRMATKQLQVILTADGYDPGPIDGKYGTRTAAAVKRMQGDLAVGVDGEVGPQTYAALQGRGCSVPEPEPEPADGNAGGQGPSPNTPAGELVTVPSVIGMDHNTANAVLANYGLHGTGGVVPFSERCVIGRQSPLPGEQVPVGTTVEWFMQC